MYFPVIRGKQFDVLALKHVVADLVKADNVRPIVEPVRDQWNNLTAIVRAGLPLALIVNPQDGNYSPMRQGGSPDPIPASGNALYAEPTVTSTLIITQSTVNAEVAAFVSSTPHRRAFLVDSVPRLRNPDPIATAVAAMPQWYAIHHSAVPPSSQIAANVDVQDHFNRADTNVNYPFDEFYTDRHITILRDAKFEHFGDYLVQGEDYNDAGGGRARNVALHHVYMNGPKQSELRVRHYVSAQHPDIATMWHDALSQLVADLPNLAALSPLNETKTCDEYRALLASAGYPGLGKMKEYAFRHQLLLMSVVQK
jgi:hypothetical protein